MTTCGGTDNKTYQPIQCPRSYKISYKDLELFHRLVLDFLANAEMNV